MDAIAKAPSASPNSWKKKKVIGAQGHMKQRLTIEQVKAEIRRMDPNLNPRSEDFRVAVVVLSCLAHSGIEQLCAFTGYSRTFVVPLTRRLRAGGVIARGGVIRADWFSRAGGIAFWLDVAVAQGRLRRDQQRA